MLTSLSLLLATFGVQFAFTKEQIIHRDVCIIGGGSSGTHAAVRLHQKGKSVALIEKAYQLGGHFSTWNDPDTGRPYNLGVSAFSNISVVRDYFAHFNIPLFNVPPSSTYKPQGFNFRTGQLGDEPPGSELWGPGTLDALNRYDEMLARYPSIATKWDIPMPVPEDLLMPYGDFLKKYNLEELAYTAFYYNEGVGNVLAQPALYMLRYFDRQQVRDYQTNFVLSEDNYQLFVKAADQLGQDVFLNSDVTEVIRRPTCVDVWFTTPQGQKHIRASKLLISIPPTLPNVHFLDFDRDENELFGQFNNSYFWTSIVQNSGLPANLTFGNIEPDAPYKIPSLPAVYFVGDYPGDPATATYGSPYFLPDEQVKANILATVERIRRGGGYAKPKEDAEIVAFENHSPFALTVSREAIINGFYARLQALQGRRRTWWTGATWSKPKSSAIWNFTEYEILPKLLDE